jgi:hypothetical protein
VPLRLALNSGKQVAPVCVRLFDETRSLHGLRTPERLIEYGTLLHDIGWHRADFITSTANTWSSTAAVRVSPRNLDHRQYREMSQIIAQAQARVLRKARRGERRRAWEARRSESRTG